MCPSEALDHAHWELRPESRGFVRIVVQDRSHSGDQVLDSSPNQAKRLRNPQLLTNWRFIGAIDICSPSTGIGIWAVAEPWEKAEFQVIMRIDQAREDEKSLQVDDGRAVFAGSEMDAAVIDSQVESRCLGGAKCNSCAFQNHAFSQRPIQTAGMFAKSAKRLPAVSNIGRSGSPKCAWCSNWASSPASRAAPRIS